MFKKFFFAILLSSALPVLSMEQPSFEWEYLPPEITQKIAQQIIDDTKLKESKELFKILRATNKFFSSTEFITSYKKTILTKAKEKSCALRGKLNEHRASFQTMNHVQTIINRSFKTTNKKLNLMEIKQRESINAMQTKLDIAHDVLRFFENNSEKLTSKK